MNIESIARLVLSNGVGNTATTQLEMSVIAKPMGDNVVVSYQGPMLDDRSDRVFLMPFEMCFDHISDRTWRQKCVEAIAVIRNDEKVVTTGNKNFFDFIQMSDEINLVFDTVRRITHLVLITNGCQRSCWIVPSHCRDQIGILPEFHGSELKFFRGQNIEEVGGVRVKGRAKEWAEFNSFGEFVGQQNEVISRFDCRANTSLLLSEGFIVMSHLFRREVNKIVV